MNNLDIATGKTPTANGADIYATTGQMDTWAVKNVVPPVPEPTCYVLALSATCSNDQIERITNGTARIENYVLVEGNKGVTTNGGSGAGGTGMKPKKNEGEVMERWSGVGVAAFALATGGLLGFGW